MDVDIDSDVGACIGCYIKRTAGGTFGAFQLHVCNRTQLFKQCSSHIERLLVELDKRFAPSPVQEKMTVLFDPQYLATHKTNIESSEYGRAELDFLRDKYKGLVGFDSESVRSEWEMLKPMLARFMNSSTAICSQGGFWQQFLSLNRSMNDEFLNENKNIHVLLSIYLISPTNSAECERGVC